MKRSEMVDILTFVKSNLTNSQQDEISDLVQVFCIDYDIKIRKIILDFRKTVNNYKTNGLFGGFLDLYNKKTKEVYFNPHGFIEYQEYSSKNIAHLLMHELIHVKQLQNKKMIIDNPNKLRWKGKTFYRAPFNTNLFNRLRTLDGALAEEYHWRALPWEREAYVLPEEFMQQPLWKAYAEFIRDDI